MGKQKNIQDTTSIQTNTFVKGLNKDSDPSYVTEGMWTHSINAVNNTAEGDIGTLSNESSNFLCSTTALSMPALVTKKHIIGTIYLYSDKWIIFTAGHNSLGQPITSEIGLFEEDICLYRPIVQDSCLAFDKRYLISGTAREKEDCSWQVYWVDGLNPDRYLNVGDPKLWPNTSYTWLGGGASSMNFYANGSQQILWPGVQWVQNCKDKLCEDCIDLNQLDCDKIRLARLMETPCLNLTLGQSGGTLANGTYFATIAYAIKGQRVTDYFSQSNNQFIFTVNDLEGSLELEVNADSENFSEFILVIVQNINQGTVAKQFGIYSTKTNRISIDQINPTLITVPLEQLPVVTPVFETSDQMTDVNDYLLRVGPKTKFDFNYQPLANLIATKWASVEYPADYYVKGGNKTNYLRDEVYTFFIRWVYDTGDKSASYHIPGRAPRDFNIPTGGTKFETEDLNTQNTLATDDTVFEVYNTASLLSGGLTGTTTDDGGTVIAVGDMGYWESTESYPDNRADIWNASSHCWTGVPISSSTGLPTPSSTYDLCGQKIRHHKFPEDYLNNNATTNVLRFRPNNPLSNGPQYFIRILGVYFENIRLPKDNDGNDIPGIVGYEMLRGSREGNKTIIAKGMVNNFRTYQIKGSVARNRTGLYANYPFNTIKPLGHSTTPSDHNYNYNDPYIKCTDENGDVVNQTIPTDIFTFHSPDTMFRTPYLSTSEFKLYGSLQGITDQAFQEPNGHPKFKLLSPAALIPIIVTGVAEAIISMIGKRTMNMPEITAGSGTADGAAVAYAAFVAAAPTLGLAAFTYNTFLETYYSSGQALADVGATILGTPTFAGTAEYLLVTAINTASVANVSAPYATTGTIELPAYAMLPLPLRLLGAANQFSFYFAEGAEVAIRVLYSVVAYRQYALQQVAYGYYSTMVPNAITDVYRFKIEDSFYLRDNIQEVSRYQDYVGNWHAYNINNLKRSDAVTVRTKTGPYFNPAYPDGVNRGPSLLNIDQSLVTLGTIVQNNGGGINATYPSFEGGIFQPKEFDAPFQFRIASHYGALKGRVRNQYGQLGSVNQIAITPCEQKLSNYAIATIGPYTCAARSYTYKKITTTPVFFNGDTYINRYTEKNNMMFFYDWLFGQPDGYEFNYYLRNMIPSARFRVNSQLYELQNLADAVSISNPNPGTGFSPAKFYNLDYYTSGFNYYNYTNDNTVGDYPGIFSVRNAYFYLANSSIKDFFVESEVLIDARKQGVLDGQKHYDPYKYTDYISMFNMDPLVMGRLSEYIYDYSLSVSKLYTQYFSAGNLQSRYYDPVVSELCYSYYPDRVIYSLPQQFEAIKDSWFVFLANNYKEFKGQISAVKAINKSGIIITFKNESPIMYQGVDTLQTDLNTKITIGDGGLFSQPMQSISNADRQHEYGSSQNRLSVIATPVGIYYMSQNQGKIFSYGQALTEISQQGLKWWYILFMPYKLTEDFPEYPYLDNPVAGIGCQSVYDSSNSILYFCKKDYKLKPEYKDKVRYIPLQFDKTGDYFRIEGQAASQIQLGDPLIFENASWTTSYDPKNNFWISFHDWHPDLTMPTKDIFITSKNNTLWKHNLVCDDYCQYYGVRYGFEIELPIITTQTVNTLRSVEYLLESYRRSGENCVDQHHVLDYNFDRAIIYNSEQVSGYLNLNLYPKNDINLSLQYPKIGSNLASYDILYSKEEQKYRINQFWDITRNRAEFPTGSDYPPTGALIPGTTILNGNYASDNTWITPADGYSRVLNPANMTYTKEDLQRKKFRHYQNFLILRKSICDEVNMILKIVNSKNQISLR